jgi:hypothetical protein
MEMTTELAYSMINTLGAIFKDALDKAGKSVDSTPLMHGLAAYTKLGLEGEDAKLDEAYKIVMNDMMEAVRGSWKAA